MAKWAEERGAKLLQKVAELEGGDFLFLISCGKIVKSEHRSKYRRRPQPVQPPAGSLSEDIRGLARCRLGTS